jgi:hypothetical protein
MVKRTEQDLTAAAVEQLADRLRIQYGTRVRAKEEAPAMHALAHLLDALGVQDHDAFLTQYSITLGYDVWLCFRPGTDQLAPIQQVKALGHEHEHVVIMQAEGAAAYGMLYATSPAWRAVCEARCYTVDLELHWLWTRATRGRGVVQRYDMAATLAPYGCRAGDCVAAQRVIDSAARVLRRGGVGTELAQRIGRWRGWL